MKIFVSFFLIFFCNVLFGQFKFLKSQTGDPITEIIDPSQMKQGEWKYFDSHGVNFRTEIFKDDKLLSNTLREASHNYDVKNFTELDFNSMKGKEIELLKSKLLQYGNGEVIIFDNSTMYIHFYFDKLKVKSPENGVDLSTLKKLNLKKSIIKF